MDFCSAKGVDQHFDSLERDLIAYKEEKESGGKRGKTGDEEAESVGQKGNRDRMECARMCVAV